MKATPAVPEVCVVDPCCGDYQAWTELAATGQLRLSLLSTPAAALRRAREGRVDLWVINAELPQISGAELCAMLKNQSLHASICLVADEYTPELERSAFAARASLFLCKGSHAHWLAEWLGGRCGRPLFSPPIDVPDCPARSAAGRTRQRSRH